MDQTVDLLAKGYTAEQLDAQPEITCSEWVASRWSSQYYLTFKLLGADNNPDNPIATYNFGTQAAPISLDIMVDWFEQSYTFSGYGAGVRYVYIKHGGKDAVGWAGHYGAHFDDASVTVSFSNTAPILGHTANNVLGTCTQDTDGSGNVNILFRIQDADTDGCTTLGWQYSDDG